MRLRGRIQATHAVRAALLLAAGWTAFVAAAGRGETASAAPLPLTDAVTAPARDLSRALASVAAHVRPMVVSVYSERLVRLQSDENPFSFDEEILRRFFGPEMRAPEPQPREYRFPQRGTGSGIVLDKQGHILTNYHVAQDVDEIKVQLADKRTFEAEVVGTDPKTDVAVLKIKGRVPDDIATADFGDSDAIVPGDMVMAIGAPFGLSLTVTTGIISAKGRANVGIADYEDFLQTDTAVNPGSSGGPLANMRGEVIGMNTAIATSDGRFSGVSFAIPVNMLKSIVPVLIKGGTVQRGLLGIVIQDVTQDLARQFQLPDTHGAVIAEVAKDSPAEKAGIRVGDVVVRYDGKAVEDSGQVFNLVAATPPGSKVEINLLRGATQKTVTATVGRLAALKTEAAKGSEELLSRFGLTVQPLTPEL